MRVAAIGAIAAKHLSRKDSQSIGFIGAGEQAKMHLLGMKVVRPNLKECRVSAKSAKEEEQFIDELSPIFPDMTFIPCHTVARNAIVGADIIVTATSAQAPLLKAEWMKEGAFYSHIGGWEDEYEVALQCDKIVCDDWDTVTHRTQTLSRMYKEGLLSNNDIHADLHELVSGHKVGRESDKERTYFNAVGLAYVDISLAHAMFKRAESAHIGLKLDLQETMVFEHHNILSKIRL
ncbi:MAG: ornithine cyclodeaminase family protein, partial [Methyloprofundus sp.]|nr:ornithine cyclodeaminase family protein [Methyloprofundus sp.]